jgi:hypothetical protein
MKVEIVLSNNVKKKKKEMSLSFINLLHHFRFKLNRKKLQILSFKQQQQRQQKINLLIDNNRTKQIT